MFKSFKALGINTYQIINSLRKYECLVGRKKDQSWSSSYTLHTRLHFIYIALFLMGLSCRAPFSVDKKCLNSPPIYYTVHYILWPTFCSVV